MKSFKEYITEIEYEKSSGGILVPKGTIETDNKKEKPQKEKPQKKRAYSKEVNIKDTIGTFSKSFDSSINYLETREFSEEAKDLKEYFESNDIFFDKNSGLANTLSIVDSRDETGKDIKTIKSKTTKGNLIRFLEKFKELKYAEILQHLFSVLRSSKVTNDEVMNVLSNYLPSRIMDSDDVENILIHNQKMFSQEAAWNSSTGVHSMGSNFYKNVNKVSELGYIVFNFTSTKSKEAKQKSYAQELHGTTNISSLNFSDWMQTSKAIDAERKRRTDTEKEENLKSDNDEDDEQAEKEENLKSDNDEMSAKVSTEEPKKDPDKINKKYEDILQQKTYSGDKIESIEELDMDLKKLKETFEKIKTDEVDNKFEKIKDEFINNISQNTGEDYKELKKQLKTVKLHGGVLGSATMKLATDNAVKNRTEKAKIEIAESMINEISIPRNVDKLTHKSRRKEKSESKIMSTSVSKIIRKQEKIIRENEKSVKDRIEKLTIEYSRRFDSYYNKAEKKVKNLASFKKTIKNALSQQIIDIGYSINMARSTVSSYAGRVEHILKEYRNSLLAINEKIKMETEKLENEKETYNYKVKEKKFSERLSPRLADIQELLKKEKERKEETKELVNELKGLENKIYLVKMDNEIDEKEKQKRIDAAISKKKEKEEELKAVKKEREEISAELQRREKEEYSEKKEKEQEKNKAIDSYLSRDSKSGEGEAPGTIDKIKTFSSETKDAVKNTIDRVQLKKKFDEVKKEFSQKKTISANIKDRMTNFIKKLAEKPSTVETAKIMLDRNRPKTQQTTQPAKKPESKAVNESVSYLTEDELSSNIANKTAELFKPHKLANDKIFINLRKAVNAGDKDAFVKPLVEIKNTLLSGNAPSITILTYADGMINFMNTVITKIDDLDDKMTDEEYKDVISAVNALNSFIETGLTNLQNQLEKSFSTQPQQEQPENIPANAKAALTTETGEEEEEKPKEDNEEESEEENEEPKNLLALAKKKFRSNK
jgi:hypothetical protein